MELSRPLCGGYENIGYVYVYPNGKLNRDPRQGVATVPYVNYFFANGRSDCPSFCKISKYICIPYFVSLALIILLYISFRACPLKKKYEKKFVLYYFCGVLIQKVQVDIAIGHYNSKDRNAKERYRSVEKL